MMDPAPFLSTLLEPAEQPDELGRLGGYRVLKILGQGGMGLVLEVEDPQLQRRVALKVMLPHLASDPVQRERFLREGQAAVAIDHDHVVAVYHVGEHRGLPFLAMKLLEGETLQTRLERREPFPANEIIRIGREIARGLEAVHLRGLIHRDLKPANLFLEEKTARVVLLDFGLARGGGDARVTRSDTIVGTPAYLSPEQASAGAVDARSDLFSLGCILYELCTGAPPFQGADILSSLMALAVTTPLPPATTNPAIPAPLSDLVLWLLAKDPAQRPASTADLIAKFDALERSFAEPHRAVSIPHQRAGRTVRRRRFLWTGGLVLTALAGLVLFLANRGPAEHPEWVPAKRVRFLVPAYFYPSGAGLAEWDKLIAAAAASEIVAIVNVANGAGTELDPSYAALLQRLANSSITILGYVATDFGGRPLADVQREIDTWRRLYPQIHGFFLDQATGSVQHLEYFTAIARYARQGNPATFVILNPGERCDEQILASPAFDLVGVSETSARGFDWDFSARLLRDHAGKLAVFVSEVSDAEEMKTFARELIRRGIGCFFLTDGRAPNPWNRLPSWWQEEIDAVLEAVAKQRR